MSAVPCPAPAYPLSRLPALLGCSRRTLYRWMARAGVQARRPSGSSAGRSIGYLTPADLDKLLSSTRPKGDAR